MLKRLPDRVHVDGVGPVLKRPIELREETRSEQEINIFHFLSEELTVRAACGTGYIVSTDLGPASPHTFTSIESFKRGIVTLPPRSNTTLTFSVSVNFIFSFFHLFYLKALKMVKKLVAVDSNGIIYHLSQNQSASLTSFWDIDLRNDQVGIKSAPNILNSV